MEQEIIKLLNKTFVLIAVLAAGILIFLFAVIGYQQQSISLQNANQITVSGEGKIYAKPDVALIALGVTTNGKTVADVTAKNTDGMNAVINAVKKMGVADKDIQTTNYSLTPVYSNNYVVPTPVPVIDPSYSIGGGVSGTMIRTGSTLTGYRLEQDVQVKIRDFTKIGDILSGASASGANTVGNLQFTIDNPEKFKDQARAQAIAQAKVSAANLAKESGINLGKIINVIEGGYVPSPVMYSNAMGLSKDVSAGASPVIQPGQQEIDVTINLTYQVR